MSKDKCFVIMPFGTKPIPDEPNKSFDFDKVYRTVIRRAVEEAGMEAIRADEPAGSHIIHSDMFRELWDRAVLLADLSLGNPNVYYELGIRHVLLPSVPKPWKKHLPNCKRILQQYLLPDRL